jgi:hypothetical protein
MTPQQRIDWINYVDEISHRLHQLMAINAKLQDRKLAFFLELDFEGMSDALQATKDLLPNAENDQ